MTFTRDINLISKAFNSKDHPAQKRISFAEVPIIKLGTACLYFRSLGHIYYAYMILFQ